LSRVLVVGDLHSHFIEKGYLAHCKLVKEQYKCDKVVFVGDIIECHSISRHEKSPKSEGSKIENEKTREALKEWFKTFPNAYVCVGNHDERPTREGARVGISEEYFKSLSELTGSPKGWKWGYEFQIDDVIYKHGHGGTGGRTPHMAQAERRRRSLVIGHFHSVAGIEYSATDDDVIFGMCVGCGIDSSLYPFDYAKNGLSRPIVACGIVVDGWLPIIIKRNMGSKVRRVK